MAPGKSKAGGGGGISGVLAGQVVPADVKHLHHHAGAVEQGIDAGSVAVGPDDGDFLYFEFELSRQEENLRIESPAFDLLQRKDCLGGRLFESFEAALRVFEMQAEREAQEKVEDSAEELAVQGLALG